jgi:putative hemolysin
MLSPLKRLFLPEFNTSERILKRFQYFKKKVPLYIETPKYILKTTDNPIELLQIFKLRHKSFFPHIKSKKYFKHYDVDKYDLDADHIIIQDKVSGVICGTYRLISSTFDVPFYSSSEFDLSEFLKTTDIKLELGRACVHENYRNGSIIALLWKGIAEYTKAVNARYIFGCSSVKTICPMKSFDAVKYLSESTSNEYLIQPHKQFHTPLVSSANNPEEIQAIKKLLPPLLRTYLSAGAEVHGLPSLDKEFECIDFLTILDRRTIKKSFAAKYEL